MLSAITITVLSALFACGSTVNAAPTHWQVAVGGDDNGPGTAEAPFRTINAAAQKAFPGDFIIVHGGTYREEVIPPRGGEEGKPITYMAAPGEKVFIKGSDLYEGTWVETGHKGVWEARIEDYVAQDFNPFGLEYEYYFPGHPETMPGAYPPRTCGQVFLNDRMLDETHSDDELIALPGTWKTMDNGKTLRVHMPPEVVNPASETVEISVRKAVFRPETRGLGYITIRGFHLEHAANQAISKFWQNDFAPQQGLVSCRSGHHWTIENNTIRFSKSIGIDVGTEGRRGMLDGQPCPKLVGYHLIKGNVISDHGQSGLCGLAHIGTQIIGNVFERNNNLGASTWEEAAIKTHFYINGLIKGNLIRNNYTHGIWLDNVYQNVRITGNVILENGGYGGVFLEMGGGPCLIDNNVIGLSTTGQQRGHGGNGVYGHDAGGVIVAHNFLVGNANYGVFFRKETDRSHAVYPAGMTTFEEKPIGSARCDVSHIDVLNNIIAGNHRGAVNLPYPGPYAEDNRSDGNLFDDDGTISGLEDDPRRITLLFGVNATGGTSAEDILRALEAAREAADVSDTALTQLLPSGNGLWLTMPEWTTLMDSDRNSRITGLTNGGWQILHPGPGAYLKFRIKESPSIVSCSPVPGVDRDFYGVPVPADQPMPGPFQALNKAGAYNFPLWPLRNK